MKSDLKLLEDLGDCSDEKEGERKGTNLLYLHFVFWRPSKVVCHDHSGTIEIGRYFIANVVARTKFNFANRIVSSKCGECLLYFLVKKKM